MHLILLLSGKAGSGKDMAGKIIVDTLPNWTRVAFADYLKDEVASLYGVPRDTLDCQEGKKKINQYHITNRELLINHATRMRAQQATYWVDQVISKINGNTVITDFRYPNEYNELKKRFANVKTMRIHRKVATIDTDSEKMLDDFDFDFHIDNNANIEHLKQQLYALSPHFQEHGTASSSRHLY